jgi:hypothetical protein
MIGSSFKVRCEELVQKYPNDLRKAARILSVEFNITSSVALSALRSMMLSMYFG